MFLPIIEKAVHHPFFVLLSFISFTSAGSIVSRVHNTTDPPEFQLSVGKYEVNLNPSIHHSRPIRFRPVRVRPVKSPRPVSWNQYDACGGNILVPLSNDRNILIEQTYKSTDFPGGRTHPLVCSWKVEVSNTNCNRGLVTMTVDELSRLSDEEGCLNGYYRVSPFMKEAKICGRIGTVPPFQWHVDDQQTENVTINLKHIGLNDGDSEGLSFTLTGECLPNEVNVTIDGSRMNSNSYWLVKGPEDYGVPTVVLSGDELNSYEQLDTRELKEDLIETPSTTTLSTLNVTLGFSMDYYRNRKSTGPQISETPTTPSPKPTPRTARPPSHIKSTTLTTPVTKRPSNRNPSHTTKNTPTRAPSTTIRPHTRRPTTHLSRPSTTTKRPATTRKRPATTSKRPTTRSPITKSPVTKRPMNRHPPSTTKTPAIRVPSTTIRPAIRRPTSPASNDHSEIPWLILKSPQPEHEFSSSVMYSQELVDHAPGNKITPVPLKSKGEIPWLILKTPHHNQLLSKVDPIVRTSATTKSPHTKSPTKTATKTPAKVPTKTVAKIPTKITTRTPFISSTKSPSRNPTKSPTRSPTKKPVMNPAKIHTKTSIKSATKTKIATKESSRNSQKNPSKSSSKSPSKTPSKSPAKIQSKTPTKSPVKSPTVSASRSPPSKTSPINNLPAQDLFDTKTKCPESSAFNFSTAIYPFTRRPPVRILPPSWDQYDTCGGTINVPLSFDRLSSYESSQFPAGRNFPLVCTWTVKVRTTNCSRGRITLRVDGRSRLADVKGCTKGYFSVFPFLMQAKICGRIGIAPPLHWYVEDQQSEDVTIVMENVGLDDGRSEGFSFSLQGECISHKPDKAKLDVDVENFWSHNRWMNRLSEDFRTGDGPRVVAPGVFASTMTLPVQEIETDGTDASDSIEYEDYIDVTEATFLQHPITSKPWTIPDPDAEPEQLYTTVRPPTTTSSYPSTTVPQVSHRSTTTAQPTTRTQPTTTTQSTTRTAITRSPMTSTTSTEIPWLILQSPDPNHTPIVRPKSTTKQPVVSYPTTKRPVVSYPITKHSTVLHTQTTPPVVTRRPATQYPVNRFVSTTVRPTTTTRSPPTKTRPVPTTSIPWLILKSSFLNQTNHSSSTGSKNTTNNAQSSKPSSEPTVVKPPIGFYNTEWHTDSSSTYVPTVNGGQLRVDTCQGNVVVPLTADPKSHKEFITLKSTWFPFNRITPLICSWNVKASKNCQRGIITMTIDERSRLADDTECLRGYYRVAPFMNDSKICGRVHTVPAFQWFVDHHQPEDVSIILKHVGLNDGYSEGLSFTLSGECLPEKSDLTKNKAIHSYKDWLQQLASQSRNLGVPTVILPDVYFTSTSGSSLSNAHPQAKTDPEDFSDTPLAKQSPETSSITAANSPDPILSLSSFYPNVTSADPIHFPNASNDDLEDLWLILQSPSSRQSLSIPSEDESNNVSLEVSKTPNIPVDDMFDDALSYITRLLNETKKISNPLKKRQ